MQIYKNGKNNEEMIIIFLFFLSYYFFFLSLEKCLDGEGTCCRKFQWMKKKVIEEIISCILTIILLELIILKKISKLHLIHFSVVFSLFYFYSNGIDFDNHGYYNIKYFFIIIIFFLIILFIVNCLLSLKKKKIILIYLLISLIFAISLKNTIVNFSNCNDWPKGLNNTSIDNDINKYGCVIKIPKYCIYKIGKFFLDKDRFSSCVKKKYNPKNLILKYSRSPFINKNTLHIGFPLTNKNQTFFQDMSQNTYKKYFYEGFIDMNNHTLVKLLNDNKPEISVDFSKKESGILNINLNFNKTLSQNRKKLEKATEPLANNIFIMFIDSVSRASSIRQLKKTLKFFERFMPFKGNRNSKYPNSNFHSFQFFKYHSHSFYTSGNYPILFYGKHRNMTNKYITSYLKRNGYITGYSADECNYDFTRTFHNFSFDDIYDHQYIICDPSYGNLRSKLNCLYGKIHIEYMLEYVSQFWKNYKNNRKFQLILTNFAHENTLEKLKYIDNILFNFFNRFFEENLLKSTSIFLLSDHGVAVPSLYYLNDFFSIEKVLPMFYLLVNDRNNHTYESQYKFLYQNQQTFITGFDIYNTIIHFIYGDNYGTNITKDIISKEGQSLFTFIDQKERNPKMFRPMVKDVCV